MPMYFRVRSYDPYVVEDFDGNFICSVIPEHTRISELVKMDESLKTKARLIAEACNSAFRKFFETENKIGAD